MSTRRFFLSTALAGTTLALSGRNIRAQSADPYAAWAVAAAPPPADWRLAALRWAVLAPNPHNRQPWLATLVDADTVELRCDLERRLPVTDPFDRQIAIGLGAFAELFRMAAAAAGIAVVVEPFPDGEPAVDGRLDTRPVARLRRVAGAAVADPLFQNATARRSAKRPFDTARVAPPATLAAIGGAAGGTVGFVTQAEAVERLKALVWEAWLIEARTPAAHLETVSLMRLGSAAVAANPDGVSVSGPQLDPLIERGVLNREAFAAPGRPGYEEMIQRYTPMLAATNAYVFCTGPASGRAAQLAAGAQWLRLNLATTAAGLALHPVSQALQEYPEMAGSFRALHAALGVSGAERVQMLGRIGFLRDADRAPPTPRWLAETRVVG